MTLNISGEQSTDRIASDAPPPADDRRRLAEELVRELTDWNPRERMAALGRWHRGALSLVHLHVLSVLATEGAVSMSGLAEAMDISVASATGIVSRMEARRLVERRHSTADRRVVEVHPTETGEQILREMDALRRSRLGTVLEELTDDEMTGFLRGVRALRAARARLVTTEDAASDACGRDAGTGSGGAR